MTDLAPAPPTAAPETSAQVGTSTSERILDAGVRLWELEGTALLTGALTIARISTEAGVTRSTFYSYWTSLDDYLLDLIDHLGRRWLQGSPMDMTKGVADDAVGDTVSRFLSACRETFLLAVDDPIARMRLGLLAMHDERTTERLVAVIRSSEEALDEQYALIRRSWGRVMRPPITEAQLQIVFTSLVDGLAIRRHIDPDSVPDDLFGLVVMCLMIFITKRADDPRELHAMFGAVNAWPVTGARLQARLVRDDPFEVRDLDSPSMQEIIVAARRLTARSGWDELSMADVSAVTGIPEMALMSLFGSKAGLALALLRLAMDERFRDIPEQPDGITELRDLLRATHEEIARMPAISQSILSIVIGSSTAPRRSVIDWDPESRIDAAMQRAIDQGTLTVHDAPAFRRLVLRTLIVETTPLLARNDLPLDLIELLLVGAGAPPLTATR